MMDRLRGNRFRRLSRVFSIVAILSGTVTAQTLHRATRKPEQASHAHPQKLISTPAIVDLDPTLAQQNWSVYGGENGDHYSTLTQISRQNVSGLTIAWKFDTGETGGMESSPLIVNGVLYGLTPTLKVFALNATTGKLFWEFDSGVVGSQPSRGLTYWSDDQNSDDQNQNKDRRIFVGIMNYLYALDAVTGKPIAGFGNHGRIDLRENLDREPASKQSVFLTSPGVIYKDLLIVGGRNPETLPAPPGNIRAYDVRTGKLRWAFHTIPRPGEFGYDTWPKDAWRTSGAANNWAGMTLDRERGIVYVPTGSAASDFYGGDRVGDDLFADSLLALDASTGKRIWHFQEVRHDVWDRDFPAPPALLIVKHDGKNVAAVAQTSKQGFVFLFDRLTGEPLFPMETRKYPPSNVPGEVTAPEQVLPARPAPYARQILTEDLLTDRTPAAHQWAVEQFRKFRSAGQFIPFSVGKDTVVFPGFDGGAEWGGPAVDPHSGVIYVNANDVAWTGALALNTGENTSKGIYLSQCGVCHGTNRAGSPPAFPSLIGIGSRLSLQQISATIRSGKGRMPGFTALSADQVSALVNFLTTGESKPLGGSDAFPESSQYSFTGYKKFLDPEGYPAVVPPWGTLSAINLNTGDYIWKIPLGYYPDLAALGKKNTGTENYGGPIVTAGGLVFIAATNYDKKIRAFDEDTGKLLWEADLPFAGNATPATYEVNGRQFVVIAAGGGKALNAPSGGVYVAFALPQ